MSHLLATLIGALLLLGIFGVIVVFAKSKEDPHLGLAVLYMIVGFGIAAWALGTLVLEWVKP